jgi:hypothetical protein
VTNSSQKVVGSKQKAVETDNVHGYLLVADVQDVFGNPNRGWAYLFEVCDLYGYSWHGWTPMTWRLRELLEGPAGRRTDDWEFDLPATYVYEFLYLQCDHNGGRRDFGPQGKYNATPLWPEALSFFMNQIEKG